MSWRDIKGYENFYQINDKGQVKSLKRTVYRSYKGKDSYYTIKESMLRPDIKNGYFYVALCKNSKIKHHYIHRLVAEYFVANPENKTCVNHIDSNRLNNSIENLEWVTYRENSIHGVKYGNVPIGEKCKNSKLSEKDVLEIRDMYIFGFKKTWLSEIYSISFSAIDLIVRNKRWKHIWVGGTRTVYCI